MSRGNPNALRTKRRENVYVFKGEIVEIHVPFKTETLIGAFDKSELEKVDIFCWSARYDSHVGNYYLQASIKGQTDKRTWAMMHRMICNEPKGMVIDHINGNTLDNRKENLRVVSNGQNSQNRKSSRKGSASGIRGVSYRSDINKWRVRVAVNYKHVSIGNFETLEEAEQASIEARKQYMPYSQEALAN